MTDPTTVNNRQQTQIETDQSAPSAGSTADLNRSFSAVVVETLPGRYELRTDNPLEEQYGHTRVTRRGPFVAVSGTTANDGTKGVLHPESTYYQAVIIFERIANALQAIGAQMTDVIRVRMFITDMADQGDVGRAFKEAFYSYGIRVVATLVQVSALVHPDMRVEIEADAIVL